MCVRYVGYADCSAVMLTAGRGIYCPMIPHSPIGRRQMTATRCHGFIWRGIFALMLAGFIPNHSICQTGSTGPTTISVSTSASSISPSLDILVPRFLRAIYHTRAWVRDSLGRARTNNITNDVGKVDQIYRHALAEANGDHTVALLAAAIATLEHRHIPLAIGIDLPLTFESRTDFNRRVATLPRRLFADRPNGDDRDKLQHFFASAWLTLALGSRKSADAIGWGIERGEQLLLSGQAQDLRDIRANRLGQRFAELLKHHPTALPSMMFNGWNRKAKRGRSKP